MQTSSHARVHVGCEHTSELTDDYWLGCYASRIRESRPLVRPMIAPV